MRTTQYAFSSVLCIVALTGIMAVSTGVHACLGRINIPDINKPGQYYAIFTASVASFARVPDWTALMDITASYKIRVLPNIRPVHGEAPKTDELFVEGACGSPVPEVGEVGLFFQPHRGGSVIPLHYYPAGSGELEGLVERIRRSVQVSKQ